jgi:hypothetical protein
MAVVIGLDTMGIDTSILYVFAQAVAYGAAAALAIGAGVALGWGGKDYVSENIAEWMGRTGSASGDSERRGSPMGPGATDGGESGDVDKGDGSDHWPGSDTGSGPRGH